MRILYGVCGEGFGHSSRAKEIITFLEKKGHKVKVLSYGQAYDVLKPLFDVEEIKGMHLIFEKNKLKKRKTLKYNLENFPRNFKEFKRFHRLMKEFKPEICISDMEPLVPILSFWYKKPLFSIDNQHRLTNFKINVPREYMKDYVLAREVTNSFVRSADSFIVLSFTKLKPKKENSFIVSPVLRKEITDLKPKYGGNILVYLTKKNKGLVNKLKGIDEKFTVYGFDVNAKEENLEYKKFGKHFLKDLSSCKAVIATAGFTLISESLYLKKPYFAIPLKGQFEQTLNALLLKDAGMGDYSKSPKKRDIEKFLSNLTSYKKRLNSYKMNLKEIFTVLEKRLRKIKK